MHIGPSLCVYIALLYVAQHNQLLDEKIALVMSQQPVQGIPTLLEWAAAAIYTKEVQLHYGCVPNTLICKPYTIGLLRTNKCIATGN